MRFPYNFIGEIRAYNERFEATICSSFASSLQELSSLRSIRISGVRGTAACGEACDAVCADCRSYSDLDIASEGCAALAAVFHKQSAAYRLMELGE